MNENDYRQLKEMKVKFQLNLFSLVDAYGIEARKKAEWLLKNNFYDLAGSDTHRLGVWKSLLYAKGNATINIEKHDIAVKQKYYKGDQIK